ncbi:MAG: DUF3256 family protein [Pseudoflavonifractor sp.]|nr:DUF3256 family protein [Pseudoflavonifractor sp.]
MRHRLILLLSAMLLTVMSASAQLTASRAFATAPASQFPLLDNTTRLDMIDYFNSGSSTASTNQLRGSSRITALSPESLTFKMTDASTYQIAVLPAGKDSLITVIETVAMPARDSRMSFYGRDWTPARAVLFTAPSLRDWLTEAGRAQADMIEAMVPFLIVSYEYDPSTRVLTLTNNLSSFISPDDLSVSEYFHPVLQFRWDGKRMSPLR